MKTVDFLTFVNIKNAIIFTSRHIKNKDVKIGWKSCSQVFKSGSIKGGYFSESAMCFLDLQISKKNYSKKLSWAWNLNLLFTVFGRKFKFHAQDSFLEYFFLEIWRSKKHIALSEKKGTFSNHPDQRAFLFCVITNIFFWDLEI